MASTWNGTAGNELISGAALRDGAGVTGLYTVDVTIPTGDNTKLCSSQYITDHTTASGVQTALMMTSKDAFLSQF
jgi:hypothetical protein